MKMPEKQSQDYLFQIRVLGALNISRAFVSALAVGICQADPLQNPSRHGI